MTDNGFKIEKGVAFPSGKSSSTKFPFSEMEVGDSFFAARDTAERVSSAATMFGKYHHKKFATRKEGDGRRIWRVS